MSSPLPPPSFGPPAAPPPPPAPPGWGPTPPPAPGPGSPHRTWIIGALVVALVLGLPLLWWLTTRGDDEDDERTLDTIAVDDTDPEGNDTTGDPSDDTIGEDADGPIIDDDDRDPGPTGGETDTSAPGEGVPFSPDSIAVGGGWVWVSDSNCGVVVQLDPSSLELGAVIDIGGSGAGVVYADDAVWVGNRSINEVFHLDPSSGEVIGSVATPGGTLGLGASEQAVWAVDPTNDAVHRIDTANSELAATVEVGAGPHHATGTADAAWVTNVFDGTVTRIDAATNEPATFPVGSSPLHVAVGDGSAWVTNSGDGTVSRLDAETGDVQATITVGEWPHALAVIGDAVWVGTENDELWRIDPATDTAELVPEASFTSIDMAVEDTELWVADSGAGEVIHVDGATGAVVDQVDLGETEDCESLLGQAGAPLDPSQV